MLNLLTTWLNNVFKNPRYFQFWSLQMFCDKFHHIINNFCIKEIGKRIWNIHHEFLIIIRNLLQAVTTHLHNMDIFITLIEMNYFHDPNCIFSIKSHQIILRFLMCWWKSDLVLYIQLKLWYFIELPKVKYQIKWAWRFLWL